MDAAVRPSDDLRLGKAQTRREVSIKRGSEMKDHRGAFGKTLSRYERTGDRCRYTVVGKSGWQISDESWIASRRGGLGVTDRMR